MNVLQLASGNRWTGAAAIAFAETEALRAAGVVAHFAYVGGYKLETKIGHLEWTHPVIAKAQNPVSFLRTTQALQRLITRHRIEMVHAHLTWDHLLAHEAVRGTKIVTARTFHSRRVLRNDPLSRALTKRTSRLLVVNAAFAGAAGLRGREAAFTPPPLDAAQFAADGPSAREQYGIGPEAKVVTAIGKLSPGRGFEEVLQTFAALRQEMDGVRLMIIGHGPHRPELERLASTLGINEALTWAGYHEDDLADHYRASDLLLFTAKGSDEGHRAVIEAMGCGVPVASYPIEGVHALLDAEWIAADTAPDRLAATAATVLRANPIASRTAALAHAAEFGYERAAARLLQAYT